MVELGTKLKNLRIQSKLTQLQVAKRVGVSKSVISSYETTARCPSYEVLAKLAVLYGVTTDYLLGLDNRTLLDVTALTPAQLDAVKTIIASYRK